MKHSLHINNPTGHEAIVHLTLDEAFDILTALRKRAFQIEQMEDAAECGNITALHSERASELHGLANQFDAMIDKITTLKTPEFGGAA